MGTKWPNTQFFVHESFAGSSARVRFATRVHVCEARCSGVVFRREFAKARYLAENEKMMGARPNPIGLQVMCLGRVSWIGTHLTAVVSNGREWAQLVRFGTHALAMTAVLWGVFSCSGETASQGTSVLIGSVSAQVRNSDRGAATPEGAELSPNDQASHTPQDDPLIATRGGATLGLSRVQFGSLDGWRGANHRGALKAFVASCAQISTRPKTERMGVPRYAGHVRDWLPACRAAAKLGSGATSERIRIFFEKHFHLYRAEASGNPSAKFTGYYTQSARGSLVRHGKFQTPLLRRPTDLIEVPLSAFISDGRGRRIWGRRDPLSGALVRYPTRPEIRRSGIKESQVLVWLDDPVDAVFAEIQGSAVVAMDDGTTRWVAFDGKNGRRFRGVGGILRRKRLIKRGQGTMAGIRAWFDANRQRYHEIVDQNLAKVFFKFSDRAGSIGTQGVVLTARRSVAIDRAVIAFSTPIWVSAHAPVGVNHKNIPWQQLLIAQDTGGAIVGPIRADIYWGEGVQAEAIAGRMGGHGAMWLLLPKRLRIR